MTLKWVFGFLQKLRRMTLSVPFSVALRTSLTGLVLSAIFVQAQTTAKPAVNQGPYQPQAQASPFNGKVVEDVVARVNDQIITSSDYQRAEQQMEADARQQGWSDQELAQRKKDLLRDLVDKELLLSKGKELGITGETELIKRLDEIRKQNHLESMEDLEKAAQQQGVSYEDFKQNIRNEIISQQVIRDEVSRHIQLTKSDVTSFYQTHKSEFDQPESVHLVEILIPVTGDDPAAIAAAQAKADDVEAKLKAGGNFDELAKQYSTGPTAQTGGELGDFKRGMLGSKVLEDAAFKLQAGQVAPPIRTKQGFLILKATQHVGGSSQDFNSIQPQVEEAAFMDRMQPALRTYLTTLREQAYIDVRPGFQDAGAAAHTVKPVYSAYTPPGGKKKPKVQRTRYRQSAFRNKSGVTKQAGGTPPVGSAAAPGTATATAANGVATTPAADKPKQVAANVPSSKPVKKQKIRFGQSPTQTLGETPGSSAVANSGVSGATTTDATTGAETQVASNASSESALPGDVAPTAPKVKTRFAYRAKEPKQKKAPTLDQLENKSVGDATPEEQAAQKVQSAPLGLAGDTAKKKKEPKPKTDQKTRYADQPKGKSPDDTTPAPDTTPTSAMPSPAAAPSPTAPSDPNPSPATQQTAPQ
jgi:peptidyl-prolyl cis-trans isomerase SurA